MFFRNHRERLFLERDLKISSEELYQLSHRLSEFLNSRNKRYRHMLSKKQAAQLEKNNIILENVNIDQIESQIIDRYNRAKIVTSSKNPKCPFDTFSLALDDKLDSMDEGENLAKLLEENETRLIQALEESSENKFSQRLIFNNQGKKINEEGTNNSLIKKLLFRMIKELEAEKQFLSSINNLFNVFNEHLCDGKKIVIENNSLKVKIKDEYHSVNDLSSGERHLLTFLAFVLIDGSQKEILLSLMNLKSL